MLRNRGLQTAGRSEGRTRSLRRGTGGRRNGMSASCRENDISGDIIDAAYKIHVALGPGLLESVYETVLARELERRGHRVERQVPIAVRYESLVIDAAFRADLLVDGVVLVELKSIEQLLPVHKKQVLTYLRLAGRQLGLLLNFGAPLIKDGIVRLVHHLPE